MIRLIFLLLQLFKYNRIKAAKELKKKNNEALTSVEQCNDL